MRDLSNQDQDNDLLSHFFSRVFMFYAYTRPRYQVSVYKTIGPLVNMLVKNFTFLWVTYVTAYRGLVHHITEQQRAQIPSTMARESNHSVKPSMWRVLRETKKIPYPASALNFMFLYSKLQDSGDRFIDLTRP